MCLVRRPISLAPLLFVFAAGCQSGSNLQPVVGRVLYLEEPAEGATVVFQPVDSSSSSPTPRGIVQADGTFTLQTHPRGEGAPPGEYLVLVIWYSPDARQTENAKNRLPARYSQPSESPLKATVGKGKNDVGTFRLTK